MGLRAEIMCQEVAGGDGLLLVAVTAAEVEGETSNSNSTNSQCLAKCTDPQPSRSHFAKALRAPRPAVKDVQTEGHYLLKVEKGR